MRKVLMLSLLALLIMGCSAREQEDKYSIVTAINNGDVVSQGTTTGNLEQFQKFLVDLQNQQPANLKVTQYSKEGDPIFFTLKYDGQDIKILQDASKDKFGGGQQSYVCKSIETEETPDETKYNLTGCSIPSPRLLLAISKKGS